MINKNSYKILQKLKWQSPLKIAYQISQFFEGNWVFLYSALNKFNPNSKSYIALFEIDKYRGDNFLELQNKIQNSQNQIWFGGLNYELAEQFEDYQKGADSHINSDKIFFSKFALILEFNHQEKKLTAISDDEKLIKKFLDFRDALNEKTKISPVKIAKIYSNFSDETYRGEIKNIKKMIAEGDFFQANLTRKFYGNLAKKLSPHENFAIFARLTRVSPANYNFFARFEDDFIISSSPELFLESDGKYIVAKPIKGSIHRGKTLEQDENNKNYLKNSSKEKAENLMIVDLMRNDFARFCDAKSVKVKDLFAINSYKTIHHLSSQIYGEILPQYSVFDALKACFPPGSMTGAPKIKVIEALKNIEKLNRGIYSGAFGCLSKDYINLAVVIRTLIIRNNKFEFQVGGGITFDSNAEDELQEIYSKAKAILKILNLSQNKLAKFLR